MSGKSITFRKRMTKSWSVDPSPSIAFNNPRGAHVETSEDGLEGKQFNLGARTTRMCGPDIAVMYEVIGVQNGRHSAHLTVYFGDPKNAWAY